MGDRFDPKEDEHDVDFDDTRAFAVERWNDAVGNAKQQLSRAGKYLDVVMKTRDDWQILWNDIRKRSSDPKTPLAMRRLLNHIQPLPRTINSLMNHFVESIAPDEVEFVMLWGLAVLNLKLSSVSQERLTRTAGWSKRLRTIIELFNRCLDVCEDMNEARLVMIDVFDSLLQLFGDSVMHLRNSPTEAEATKGWRTLEAKVTESLADMEAAIKHLSEITTYSKANLERQVNNLSIRHAPIVQPEEFVAFPLHVIPRSRNEQFYGRTEELEKMHKYLDHRGGDILLTYTIYGRRGVGKTDLALEYAYTHGSGFDAIFWVQCETSLTLRQSYTDMAVKLCLPGADRNGHHEENQLAVLRWLKQTKRRWLLIFDNAEKEYILKGYWPIGCNGSILLTSRTYYNFLNDSQRKGDTVKVFNDKQGWELLMKLLGPEWEEKDRNGKMRGAEEVAGKDLVRDLGGLALAIQQAAELVKNESIGDRTIATTYRLFKEYRERLPERPGAPRTEIIKSLDTLWSMTFNCLSRNARDLLSVLALLSPDGILIDLFLPKNQRALDGKLRFCKQHPDNADPDTESALSSVISAPQALRDAIEELVNYKLISQEGREFWAHRVVQEAMNYEAKSDLQSCFNSACAIVFEAFPKQLNGDYFSSDTRAACQAYISHGAHLSRQFASYKEGGKNILDGTRQFIDLLCNCAWYLYELSDYDICLRVAETAGKACPNKNSLQYAMVCCVSGAAYYELNKLADCRKQWKMFLKLQDELLEEDTLERSSSLHNMGNLESACDNIPEAMEYFNQAIDLRTRHGDSAANLLALSYLCMSRAHFLNKEYDTAFKILGKSEALFVRTSGAAAPFMAHVHYAYGNMEFAQQRWGQAKRAYESALKIALDTAAIHPITISIYYSLGCVEFERGKNEHAKIYLDKAMTIAQLRSPNRDDGTMARILWKTSIVLERDTIGRFKDEATDMRIRAEVARNLLNNTGEGVVVSIDEEGNADQGEEEDTYDALVPGYFR